MMKTTQSTPMRIRSISAWERENPFLLFLDDLRPRLALEPAPWETLERVLGREAL